MTGKSEPAGTFPAVDSLDIAILERMLSDGRTTFKELAGATNNDSRTIASRFQRLVKAGVLKRATVEVDWSKVGFTASAYMGSTTALGEDDRRKLLEFLRHEPRVLEAYTTIGSNEYFMKVVDFDIATLRSGICAPLEPLTVDLTTSLIVDPIKSTDYPGLLRYLKHRKGSRS